MLKGVQLAKEGSQLLGFAASVYSKHQLNSVLDHLYSHVVEKDPKNVYHSLQMRDPRKAEKNRRYFAALIDGGEEELAKYIDSLSELGKDGPCCLVLNGFELLVHYLPFNLLTRLFKALQALLAKNLSRLA